MFCVPVRKSRRFIGSFTRGMEFPAAFIRVMTEHQIRSGRVTLSGQLETCTLAVDSRSEMTLSNVLLLHAGGFISDVDGTVSPCLSGVLQFAGPLGPQMAAGRILAARFAFAEFEIEAFDDIFIVRKADSKLLLPPWTDCITENTDSTLSPGSAVPEPAPVADSTDGDDPETMEESLHPEAGDWVEHFRFGQCRVLRIDGSDILEVVTPTRNKARLSMSVLRFELLGAGDDGSRRFRARPNRER